jgi:hypothetical protein
MAHATGLRLTLGLWGCKEIMSDLDDLENFIIRQKKSGNSQKLHGDALVKKNEEFIAKHREAEYQRQKSESERKLKGTLAAPAQPPLDETSRWFNPRKLTDPLPFIEPGLEYRPPSDEHNLIPYKGETDEDYKKRHDTWDLYGGRRHVAPEPRILHGIKARGTHIISRCIIT